jgi:thymidine kinase
MSNHHNDGSGYLELILGPMFSGKTTRLAQIYRTYTYIGKRVFVINYIDDRRYGNDTNLEGTETVVEKLYTHDKVTVPCIYTQTLSSIWLDSENLYYADMRAADVILINEGQFFVDLFDIVVALVEREHKSVYICGLDGDYQRKEFGQILQLIPYCDKVEKLQSLCSMCKNGKKAIFSHRISSENDQIVIGNDNYRPLCRSCYCREQI